jgi:hypothetical protein
VDVKQNHVQVRGWKAPLTKISKATARSNDHHSKLTRPNNKIGVRGIRLVAGHGRRVTLSIIRHGPVTLGDLQT